MKLVLPFILTLGSFFFQVNATIIQQTGDNVTFHVHITGLQIDYYWTFTHNNQTETIIYVKDGAVTKLNGTRFEDRLETNVKTGSITITNLTCNDSGSFEAHIFINREYITYVFQLSVKDTDGYIENAMVGTNVTLKSGLERMEVGDVVSWSRGPDYPGTEIANSQQCPQKCPSEHGYGFDKLFFDQSNGDLTISQIKTFGGIYYVRVQKGGSLFFVKKYDVTVYDHISVPNITNMTAKPTNNVCVATCSVENGPDVNLTWYKGDIIISTTSNQNTSTLTLPLEIESGDSSVYICQAQNPVSVERKTLSSEGRSCHDSGTRMNIGVVLGVSAAAAAVIALILFIAGTRLWQTRIRAGDCIGDSQRPESNMETFPQNSRHPEGSKEHLILNFQGQNYETTHPAGLQT